MSSSRRPPISGATLLLLLLGVVAFGGVPGLRGVLPPGSSVRALLSDSLVEGPFARMVTALATLLMAWLAAAELLGSTRAEPESEERAERRRRIVVWGLAILLLMAPMAIRVAERHRMGYLKMTHDGGVLYSEQAMEALLEGENPYEISYADGPLGIKFATDPYWRTREYKHILWFQPYLPLPFLAGLPLHWISEGIGLAYDQRYLHLLHLVALLLLLPRMTTRRHGALLQTVVVLNPTFSHYFILGTNDVLLIFWVLLAIHLLGRQRIRGAAWALGAAAACKQFAWVLVPMAAACLAGRKLASGAEPAGAVAGVDPDDPGAARRGWLPTRTELVGLARSLLRLWPVAAVLAVTAGPFLLWNPGAFIEDTLLFNFGLTAEKYPFGGTPGYGLANFVVALGWIDSLEHEFPLVIGTVLIFLPLYGVLLLRLLRQPSARLLSAAFGISLFVFLIFGRMFHYNYFAILAAVFAVGWLGEDNVASSKGCVD